MEESTLFSDDLPLPPARLFERLGQLPGYTWDQAIEPFHSTYNHWHISGYRHALEPDVLTPLANSSNPASSGPSSLTRFSPRTEIRPSARALRRLSASETSSEISLSNQHSLETDQTWIPVIARISTNIIRLEREFHMLRSIVQSSDPDCNHTIRPVDLIRLQPDDGHSKTLLVAIFESPGHDRLRDLVTFGPASFAAGSRGEDSNATPSEQVSLQAFFDFAIGACDCLEILHYGLKTVHGEIRGDAFHFCAETGAVKLVNTGNGARSFDNVLSEGWSSVSRELGAKYKLQFIAPEQTGRMPTEPDSRTDIYALGLFFWSMLVGKLPFEGTDPVDVVQNVLGKRLVPVSGKRMDIPDALSAVIQKMTQKIVHDRYHTISSVKRDLTQIAGLLGDGDSEALSNFQVAQGDVSSFFTLPTKMFGRQQEYDKILHIIEKANKRQAAAMAKAGTQSPGTMYALTSASSISESRIESLELASVSSDSGSFHMPPRSSSNVTSHHLTQVNTHESAPGSDTSFSTPRYTIVPDVYGQSPGAASSRVKSPSHSRSSHNTDRDSHPSIGPPSQPSTNHTISQSGSLHSLNKPKNSGKSRRSERCEVITISGPAGIGKTDLLNRIQPTVRKLGCIAITRLDRAKRVPFEPFAKLLASLLRQIFSERDVTTDYHNNVRMALRPMWPTLHRVLDLPEQLMSPGAKYRPTEAKANLLMPDKGEPSKHVKIPGLDQGQTSQDFFLANAASKNMRLMETFLEILRTLCHFKLITICLDDLEHADDETLDLVMKIIKAKLPCVLILSSRKEEIPSDQVRSIFEEDLPTITRIALEPLEEEHVMEIVATTMHQKPDRTLTPLCAVVQEKSRGNPFYVRVMLDTCYRTNCIWYSWKDSKWLFDLDRIFTEFVAPVYGEGLGLGFLTKRLQDIPQAARSIMVWGSLLGSPFSFSLVQKLLTSEFLYSSNDDDDVDLTSPQNVTLIRQSEGDLVVGLQFLVQANLLNTGKTDDEFRFGNERLAQAALSLSEGRNVEKMHFIVSQVLMKYYHDHRSRYSMAHHVALASQTIKSRVTRRLEYRQILWDAGQTAFQSGARPSALWYFRHCIALLQDDMWNDLKPDVYYDETMRLFITTSEMSWSQGHNDDALQLINEVFVHGKDAVSKSKAWIIKAKIFAQIGDHHRSMESLLTCLDELGVHLRQPTTYEECDAAYLRLKSYLETADMSSIGRKPVSKDPTIVTIGAVMAEAMTVTYWDDALTFYRMALEVMNIHIFKGGFTQIAIGCSHLAMISLGRFKDTEFGTRLSDLSLELLELCPELSTQSRGSIVHNLYVSHLRVPMASILPALEASLEASFSMGDPYLTLISISSMAMTRLYLGQDMTQLEAFCVETPEEIPKWKQDTRGGASLIAVQQVSRALQGKTDFRSADGIMSDANHNTSEYMTHLDVNSTNADRPRDIYWGLAMIPLFLFGHHTRTIQVGTQLLFTRHRLWSARVSYVIYFYLAASLLTLHNDNPSQGYLDGKMETLLEYKAEIDFARDSSEVNYGMWALILEALISEVRNDHSAAIQSFESAIDHCQIHGWPLEEALALELQGEFLVRRGAKRAARAVIQDAIASWSAIGAGGKSSQLAEKHEWLLKTATSAKTVDVGCQTIDSLLEISRDVVQEEILIPQQLEEDERRQHWIEQNGVAAGERSLDISSVGLDIIDLSSILESSQVMSSELQIDKLFMKMLEIILESCNGSDFAIIATDFDDNNGFAIAAAGDSEKGQKSFPEGLPFSEMEDRMALHISDYVMRTKEEVLVHNVLEDERFSNVSETYLANYPTGRSVIALPVVQGDRLLGVIHLEGKPNWFTQRNVVVLHLLCNQIGISLSNALLFREIRKVSAKNASMIESQKRALALAREAEQKAKNAEAEAKHNVKLKEDAARAKSIFLANISHDLRTPMNGVIGLSELLKGTFLDKEQDEYVESIRVCADTLLTLINDILDFSKLEAGKMKISTVPLNLKQTISEVIRALRYTHRDRGLETIENLDKVPPELVVLGDPVRLHQIFMNLLSNSYKFTPAGSVTVKARVAREGKGRVRLECSVTDTGIGIPDEQKARLFRPFSQADASTERSYGGSGLGLSICKAIIEDVLGGAIWLESKSGVGTTVTFHLVFSKAPKKTAVKTAWSQDLSNAENEVRRSSARDLTQIPRDQIRVCIAEDNPINQKIAVKFVTGLGLQCNAYSDGKQAVDALRASSQEGNPFHVVLMDVMMPTLDGYNATRELRRDPDPNVNEVLVIAMTASAIEGDREKCLEAGMNNYLPKPVRSPILSELLDRYLAPAPPSYPKSRLAIREKRSKASIDGGAGTSTSYSSSASDEPKPLSLEKK